MVELPQLSITQGKRTRHSQCSMCLFLLLLLLLNVCSMQQQRATQPIMLPAMQRACYWWWRPLGQLRCQQLWLLLLWVRHGGGLASCSGWDQRRQRGGAWALSTSRHQLRGHCQACCS